MNTKLHKAKGRAFVLVLAMMVSLAFAAVASAAPPVNTAPPAITGTPTVGQTLTAENGTWSNNPTSFAYQWQRCNGGGNACVSVANGTQKTYTLVGADAGRTIRVQVTATNADGSASAQSTQTPAVAQRTGSSAAPKNTSLPTIAGASTVNVVGALGVAYSPRVARLARASVLSVRSREFVDAARAVGNSPIRLLARHITPNAAAPVIVQGTFTFGYAILGEAALSFVGLGAVPPTPSLGNILADARVFLRDAPWMILCPAATLSVLILGLNLLGDGIRDALDPRSGVRL